jgi:hypothetical protein
MINISSLRFQNVVLASFVKFSVKAKQNFILYEFLSQFTTSDWHRHKNFLVNSKMEIKRFRQILTCDILEPQ